MNDLLLKNVSINLKLALQTSHDHDWYESKNNENYDLWILTEGKIQIEYKGAVYLLEPQDAFLFYPDILYKAFALSEKCHFIFIHFDAVLGTNHHALHFFPSDGILYRNAAQKELSLLQDAFINYSQNKPFSELLLIGALTTTLAKHLLSKSNESDFTFNERDIHNSLSNLNPILIYINHHIMEPIYIHELASIANLSEKYFINFFKKAMGVTPASYITDLKMRKALELLSNKKYSIKEIAEKIGYADTYTFSKAFKKRYGLPPTQMRL